MPLLDSTYFWSNLDPPISAFFPQYSITPKQIWPLRPDSEPLRGPMKSHRLTATRTTGDTRRINDWTPYGTISRTNILSRTGRQGVSRRALSDSRCRHEIRGLPCLSQPPVESKNGPVDDSNDNYRADHQSEKITVCSCVHFRSLYRHQLPPNL